MKKDNKDDNYIFYLNFGILTGLLVVIALYLHDIKNLLEKLIELNK